MSTVEPSIFGAEFVAMKQGIDALSGLTYKLRMMGISISIPSYFYGDNISVVHNTSKSELVLRKERNSVYYHFVNETLDIYLINRMSQI